MSSLESELEALRRAFDQTFAEPATVADARGDEYILILVARRPFAVPLSSLRDVGRLAHLEPVPGRGTAFVGVATVGRDLVAVFDLAQLLELDPPKDTDMNAAATWVLRPEGRPDLAFRFDLLEGQRRDVVHPTEREDTRLEGHLDSEPSRAVLRLPTLLRTLRSAVDGARPPDPRDPP